MAAPSEQKSSTPPAEASAKAGMSPETGGAVERGITDGDRFLALVADPYGGAHLLQLLAHGEKGTVDDLRVLLDRVIKADRSTRQARAALAKARGQ